MFDICFEDTSTDIKMVSISPICLVAKNKWDKEALIINCKSFNYWRQSYEEAEAIVFGLEKNRRAYIWRHNKCLN